eukprot:TRINITY_DN2333_c1_g1_i1.p1 TRINITY_DN2333_c1_g1~~TRINITY_DN2333_c1_g1_i1.p1  ORF type:complete len:197 (+),score=25.63 TRINITY_DN2333_c1_g1_i1:232-822(+)
MSLATLKFVDCLRQTLAYRSETSHSITERRQLPGFDEIDMVRHRLWAEGAQLDAVKRLVRVAGSKYIPDKKRLEAHMGTVFASRKMHDDHSMMCFRTPEGGKFRLYIAVMKYNSDGTVDFLQFEGSLKFQLAPEEITHTTKTGTSFLFFSSQKVETCIEHKRRAFRDTDLTSAEKFLMSSLLGEFTEEQKNLLGIK